MPYHAKLCMIVNYSSLVSGSLVILNKSFSVAGHLKLICLSVNCFDRSPSSGSNRRFFREMVDGNCVFDLALYIAFAFN